MFTGLIEATASVAEVREEPPGRRLALRSPLFLDRSAIGASVAINGCCLTVVEAAGETLAFEAGPETLQRTTLGSLKIGDRANVERSLRVGDSLGGHFVTGHVDGVGRLDERIDEGSWSTFWFTASEDLTRQMASKGSIAIEGVSLTLVDVQTNRFSVALIPHTLAATTLGSLSVGRSVNLETDVLAKYVERQLHFARSPRIHKEAE
jgi:riboflavin synthase